MIDTVLLVHLSKL